MILGGALFEGGLFEDLRYIKTHGLTAQYKKFAKQ